MLELVIQIQNTKAVRRTGLNKLRTCRKYKQSILTEPYVIAPLSKCHRSGLAKFHCGVAPPKIETGRYTRTPEEERLCTLCNLCEVESEEHCLIKCELYPDIRKLYSILHFL